MASNGNANPQVPIAGFDEATQKELQAFVEQEQGKAMMQAKIVQFTEMCWDKCIPDSLGGRFSRSQEGCLLNCVDRFLDTSMFTVKRIQESQQH